MNMFVFINVPMVLIDKSSQIDISQGDFIMLVDNVPNECPSKKFPYPFLLWFQQKTQNFYCSNKQVKWEDQIKHFDMPEKDIHALLLVPTNKLS
jgi:hypothetical protein